MQSIDKLCELLNIPSSIARNGEDYLLSWLGEAGANLLEKILDNAYNLQGDFLLKVTQNIKLKEDSAYRIAREKKKPIYWLAYIILAESRLSLLENKNLADVYNSKQKLCQIKANLCSYIAEGYLQLSKYFSGNERALLLGKSINLYEKSSALGKLPDGSFSRLGEAYLRYARYTKNPAEKKTALEKALFYYSKTKNKTKTTLNFEKEARKKFRKFS